MAFADAAGDWNPIHIDAIAARRLLTGVPVVHGIHAVLKTLEFLASESSGHRAIDYLDVIFEKPITHNDRMSISAKESSACLMGQDVELVRMEYGYRPLHVHSECHTLRPIPRDEPIEHSIEAIASLHGTVDLAPESVVKTVFPDLTQSLNWRQVALIMASSRMVGMVAPGLHSLFSEIRLKHSNDPQHSGAELAFTVSRVDLRFRLVTLSICGAGLVGTVKAFVRPKPTEQAHMQTLTSLVAADEFAGQRVLVVGGSRGLGELSAKLLAAGGADVLITYHQGEADAQAVEQSADGASGKVDIERFDALSPADTDRAQFEALARWRPTHLMYFATPPIFGRQTSAFSPSLVEQFFRVYVTNFGRLAHELAAGGMAGVYYPSSIVLDERPDDMIEYSIAKAAGEYLCQTFQHQFPSVFFMVPRLPRLATDQTASLMPVKNLDPTTLMLSHLRQFASEDAGSRKLV